mmetsp:Transcript_56452/g.137005  ORF Transcript_56452/g.137005 Transcript_56452/m.137005 type:complete len:208 (-) Transcript_56452:100-723(-)
MSERSKPWRHIRLSVCTTRTSLSSTCGFPMETTHSWTRILITLKSLNVATVRTTPRAPPSSTPTRSPVSIPAPTMNLLQVPAALSPRKTLLRPQKNSSAKRTKLSIRPARPAATLRTVTSVSLRTTPVARRILPRSTSVTTLHATVTRLSASRSPIQMSWPSTRRITVARASVVTAVRQTIRSVCFSFRSSTNDHPFKLVLSRIRSR